MKIVINSFGAKLSKCGELFEIMSDGQKQQLAASKIEQIIVTAHTCVTTDAIELAIDNNIDFVILKRSGEPVGRVWHSKLGSITTIRRNQLKLSELLLGTSLVKEWISQKLQNQINHLTHLKKNRPVSKVEILNNAIQSIDAQQANIKKLENVQIESVRNIIEGYEGTAGRCYFDALSGVIPEQYSFNGRNRNPSLDMFNCMLSYAYSILYSKVERACIISGIDPYIGIMHVDNYNRTSMVYDLAEMYRGHMDEIIFSLFTKKLVRKDMFSVEGISYWLNKSGKELLISRVNERLHEKIRYKGKLQELENIIEYDCHLIANKILHEVI